MQTVVGVFDSIEDAQRAHASLLRAGFIDSSLQMQSQTISQSGASTATVSTTDDGVMASIGRFFSDLFGSDDEHAGHYSEAVRRGGTVLMVTADDDSRVEKARALLAAAGAIDVTKRAEGWREEGYTGFDATARPLQASEVQADRSRLVEQGTVLPIVREEIEVGKREVDLGVVRVHSRTEVKPVQEQVQLREEHAEVERRNVDRPATEADLKAFEGGSIEVREMAERAVVSKTARVVEEVVVGTKASTRTETVTGEVRNTVVDVDNSATDYRTHFDRTYAASGGSYADYEPAYSYGSTLRSDKRYANRSWSDVEADAQRDWTTRNPNSSWERMKDAVRYGWESMTGKR